MKFNRRKEKVRVLHVLGSLDTGGIENWLMRVLRHIDADQIHIDFCCLAGSEGTYASEARSLGSKIHICPLNWNLVSFNHRFSQILSSGNYDIVHSHVHFFSGYILRQAARSGVQQRIAHSHTSPLEVHDTLFRRFYKKVMRAWIKRFSTLGLGVSKESMRALFGKDCQRDNRVQILYCGIDLAPFESLPVGPHVREKLGIPPTVPIIGHLGRLTLAKNQRFFLEIAISIQYKRSDVWFMLIGDGPLRQELEAITRQNSLTNVIFTGDTADVIPYLGLMDMLLFPSLWEGLPVAVIEAQAADLYCLCSEVITDEVSVVPGAVQFKELDGSAEEWADTCIAIMAQSRIPSGTGVTVLAKSPFSISRNVEQLTHIYMDQATPQ